MTVYNFTNLVVGGAQGNDVDYPTCNAKTQCTSWGAVDYIGQWDTHVHFEIWRQFLRFDTSIIPANATIISATLKLYGRVDVTTTADFDIRVQKWTTLDGIVDIEIFDEVDGVNYDDGLFNTSAFVENDWNTITLSDFNCITKAGYTNLCLRSSRDIAIIEPSGEEYIAIKQYGLTAPILQVDYISAWLELTGLLSWLSA